MINKTLGFWVGVFLLSIVIFLIQQTADKLFGNVPYTEYIYIPYWLTAWIIFPFSNLHSDISISIVTYILSLIMAFFLLHFVHLYKNFKHD